jgi:hypothetical protein
MQLHHKGTPLTEEELMVITSSIQEALDSVDFPTDEVTIQSGEGDEAVISIMFSEMDVEEDVFDTFIASGYQGLV